MLLSVGTRLAAEPPREQSSCGRHGATWVLTAPDEPYIGSMKLAFGDACSNELFTLQDKCLRYKLCSTQVEIDSPWPRCQGGAFSCNWSLSPDFQHGASEAGWSCKVKSDLSRSRCWHLTKYPVYHSNKRQLFHSLQIVDIFSFCSGQHITFVHLSLPILQC